MAKRKTTDSKKIPAWKQFELAVAQFLQALDPAAKVRHDVTIPDFDTGEPRQRDVWIEVNVCQHIPITILVSCKRYRTKLNEKHIDDFIGEIRSASANKGVLYSFTGFTNQAIAKATRTKISCCRLYDNQPADLPSLLLFPSLFICKPAFRLGLSSNFPECGIV